MAGVKKNNKKAGGKSARNILDRLSDGESSTVLHRILEKHSELLNEVEQIATEIISSSSIEDVADDVFLAVTSLDLESLTERAGAHSWGYVEPSEAAWELLEESIEDWIEAMKRNLDLGMASEAEAIGVGIIEGLYRARDVQNDGPLGWAPDFPVEEGRHVLGELIRPCRIQAPRSAVKERVLADLKSKTPEWIDMLSRTANEK